MSNTVTVLIFGGVVGALLTILGAIFVAQAQRKQSYYSDLIKLFGAHNWNLLQHDLDSGITVRDVEDKVAVVCYQHLNILLFVWLNKSVVENDGSLKGWRNWTDAIVKGANELDRKSFKSCYRQILTHGDLYPEKFIIWLETKLKFSVKRFPEADNKPGQQRV